MNDDLVLMFRERPADYRDYIPHRTCARCRRGPVLVSSFFDGPQAVQRYDERPVCLCDKCVFEFTFPSLAGVEWVDATLVP